MIVRRQDSIPPLENGDKLTRDEFERRYDAMPNLKKAELIEGIVYIPMPPRVRFEHHGKQHFQLIAWLGYYSAFTPGTEGGDNATVKLDLSNEPQPDAFLIIDPERNGQTRIDQDGFIVNGPELVAEVVASSASHDLYAKMNAYERNGVREYIVWRVLNEAIDWFILRKGVYELLEPDANGILRSDVFPGLWLDAAALVAEDFPTVFAVLQQGLSSPEHANFVATLRR